MKNRKLILIVSLVLAMTMSLGGTLAYLSDTDADVNTMVLGNVSIENREFERRDEDGDGKLDTLNCKYRNNELSYKLYPYSQDKRLVPAVGEAKVYDDTKVCFAQFGEEHALGRMDVFKQDELKNVQDKFVFVENTGNSDAYIRTYLAFEIGSAENAMGVAGGAKNNLVMALTNNFWDANAIGNVTINGNNFYVLEYTYAGSEGANDRHPDGIVHPGDYTYNNLAQVYITPKATNEDLIALDGNGNGKLDILVLSQAIQADGFANAKQALEAGFGVADATKVAEWFGDDAAFNNGKPVATVAELQAALNAGEDVMLTADVELTDNSNIIIAADKDVTLNLNGKTLTVKNTESKASSAIDNKGSLTIANGTVTYEGVGDPNFGYGTNTINNTGVLVIDGATIINTTNSGSSNAIDNAPGAVLTVNSGVIKSEKVTIRLRDNSTATIYGGEISGSRAVQIHLFQNIDKDTKLTINGGTFNGTELALYSYAYGNCTFAKTTVDITGGTFNGDVAFGGGNKTAQETVSVTGGMFHGELGRYLENDGWADISKN